MNVYWTQFCGLLDIDETEQSTLGTHARGLKGALFDYMNTRFGTTDITALVDIIQDQGVIDSVVASLNNTTEYKAAVVSDDVAIKAAVAVVTHVPSAGKTMTYFGFAQYLGAPLDPPIVGVIEGNAVTVTVPLGATLTALVPTFVVSDEASAAVGAVPQVSGVTSNDFTNPVVYTITADDGSTVDYTITVTAA